MLCRVSGLLIRHRTQESDENRMNAHRFSAGKTSDNPAYTPYIGCTHAPDTSYTRHPCSCGRTYWPPIGRGRGESLTSPRRLAAKMRAVEVLRLHVRGASYAEIAARLGYRDASGAWRAEQRLLAMIQHV
jgi:hypothetical protein